MSNVKELISRGAKLFSQRETLMSQWQEMAENFYPERADFTTTRTEGDQFAENLFTADPVMMSRDLANAFSWLRAESRDWFKMHVEGRIGEKLEDNKTVQEWLEKSTKLQRRWMYERRARFNRAMKEGERDYAVFGNAVTSVEINQSNDGLRYLTHHLRDCAWVENSDGRVDTIYRKLMMSARQMAQYFSGPGDVLHNSVTECLQRDNDKDRIFEVQHVMMPASDYSYERGQPKKGMEWTSCYVDVQNQQLIREASAHEFRYVVPRWQTISGSVYGVSPAAVVALPEARMLQQLARIIQEAGEKAVDPPLTAIEANIRGDVRMEAGGMTWLDTTDYDSHKMGEIIKPLFLAKNPGLGIELFVRSNMTLKDAWFVSKLQLPIGGDKTAYEISQIIEEHIRANVPLTEPIENEYYDPILALTSSILLRVGAFGRPEDMPPALLDNRELMFQFSNPLRDAVEKAKVAQLQAVLNLTGMVKTADPSSPVELDLDMRTAYRDAVKGTGAPADWLKDREEADADVEEREQQMEQMQQAQKIGGAAGVAEQVGKAGQSLGLIQGGKQAA
jgi:hypothetical protein